LLRSNKNQDGKVELSEIQDNNCRLQLTIRTKDRHIDIVVLNFCGSSPFLHLGGIAYQLTIPDHRNLRLGTLSSILSDVAEYLSVDRVKLQEELFGT
jgi:hypothetical protein